jgi:very-short-patch-repair endonuclease
MRIIAGMPMYYGAKPKLFEYAKLMRHSPTEAEKLMWKILTSNELLQYKFRRQHPMSTYIADFYSQPLLFAIEVDGGYHLTKERSEIDTIRDEDMLLLGVTIMRFTNDEVLLQPENTIIKLKEVISKLSR